MLSSEAWAESLRLLHAQGFLCVRQLPCRSELTHNALCYTVSACSSLRCELLNHLLTTAWRELRQWLVNTPEWMKGLGIKWQDVLKEEQVVVEEGPVKPCRSGTSCISLRLLVPLPSSCSVCIAPDHSHLSPVAHLSAARFSRFYLFISEFSIFIVLCGITREACSLTESSDNWHSWGWTFRSSPIHMYSERRDKSHPTQHQSPSPKQGDCRGVGWIFSFTEPLHCWCIQYKINTPCTADEFFCATASVLSFNPYCLYPVGIQSDKVVMPAATELSLYRKGLTPPKCK